MLIHPDDAHPVEPGRIGDQDPVAFGQDRGVRGVPGHAESFSDSGHGEVLDHDPFQRPPQPPPRQPRSRLSRRTGVLPPYPAAARAFVATYADLQDRGSPPQRFVSQVPGHGVTHHTPAATLMAPVIRCDDPTRDHRAPSSDMLTDGFEAELVKTAEHGQIRGSEGSVVHSRGLLDGQRKELPSWRPRPLPHQRHALSHHPSYPHPQMRRADKLVEAGGGGWNGFTVVFTPPAPFVIPALQATAYRLTAKVAYWGKPFVSVPVEMSPVEAGNADSCEPVASRALELVGLPSGDAVPCMTLPWQIAQKLHACTETPDDDRRNDRAHDLVDLQLLEALLADDELTKVREACLAVFEARDAQTWPPVLVAPTHWRSIYLRALEGLEHLGLAADVGQVEATVQAFINRIDRALAAE